MLGADAGQLDASIAKAAQEQRAGRVEVTQVAQVDYAGLSLLGPMGERSFRFGERADVERAVKRCGSAFVAYGDGQGGWRGGW